MIEKGRTRPVLKCTVVVRAALSVLRDLSVNMAEVGQCWTSSMSRRLRAVVQLHAGVDCNPGLKMFLSCTRDVGALLITSSRKRAMVCAMMGTAVWYLLSWTLRWSSPSSKVRQSVFYVGKSRFRLRWDSKAPRRKSRLEAAEDVKVHDHLVRHEVSQP